MKYFPDRSHGQHTRGEPTLEKQAVSNRFHLSRTAGGQMQCFLYWPSATTQRALRKHFTELLMGDRALRRRPRCLSTTRSREPIKSHFSLQQVKWYIDHSEQCIMPKSHSLSELANPITPARTARLHFPQNGERFIDLSVLSLHKLSATNQPVNDDTW